MIEPKDSTIIDEAYRLFGEISTRVCNDLQLRKDNFVVNLHGMFINECLLLKDGEIVDGWVDCAMPWLEWKEEPFYKHLNRLFGIDYKIAWNNEEIEKFKKTRIGYLRNRNDPS